MSKVDSSEEIAVARLGGNIEAAIHGLNLRDSFS